MIKYKYYCSTYWILNAEDLQQGAAWSSSVMQVVQDNVAFLALREGTYYIQLYETDGSSMTAGSSIRDHKGLWDEDPDYIVPYQGIEEISQEPTANSQKLFIDGNIYILRDNIIYDIRGQRVK